MNEPIHSIKDPAFRVDVLSREDIERIHADTLDVIESVGVKFPLPEALDILAANGASVDRDTCIARIPAAVVENALKSAPPTYTLADRPESDYRRPPGNPAGRHYQEGCWNRMVRLL